MRFFFRNRFVSRYSLCAALAGLLLAAASQAHAWNAQPSQPQSATFYPNEVQVTVEERLRPEPLPGGGTGFLLTLPQTTVGDSLMISINGSPAGTFFWLNEEERNALLKGPDAAGLPNKAYLPENESDPKRKALLESCLRARGEVSRLRGEQQSLELRLELWRRAMEALYSGKASGDGKNAFSPVDEASKLDAAYSQIIPQLQGENEKYGLALADAEKRLALADRALAKYDNVADRHIAVVPYTDQDGAQTVRYTYSLGATSGLSYRLNADTEKNEMSIAQDALLTQSSGFTWDNTEVFISTIRRDTTLRPGELRPWIISLRPKAEPIPAAGFMRDERKEMAPMAQMAVNTESDMLRQRKPAPAPVQEERGTFRLWSLGRQKVAHSTEVRLSLATDAYPVKFLYTLRPSLNDKGFLTADVSLPAAIELPPGPAMFSVNGMLINRAMFAFNGDKGTVFFGTDPQVTATMRNLKRASGQEGVFSKDDTLLWHWEITLKNTRSRPVDVVLEDPMPNTGNTAITITATSKPRPEEAANAPDKGGARFYRWKATLKPGEPVIVEHKVQATAPQSKDTVLEPGRNTR